MGVRLNTKGRYAVMAMVDLAGCENQRPVPLSDIADRQDISLSYLEQMFSRLRRAKLVRSVRGPGGGYLLAREPSELRVSDIFLAVEDPSREKRCSPGMPSLCAARTEKCATHDLWAGLGDEVFRYLSSVTIADVMSGGARSPLVHSEAYAAE